MDTASDIAHMLELAATTAESLDGIMAILANLDEKPDMPRSLRSSLHTLRDAVQMCRDRTDQITDTLDRLKASGNL